MLTLRRVLTEHNSETHDDDDDDSGGGGDDDDDDDDDNDDDVNNNRINPALPQKYATARNRIVWCLLCFLEMAFVQSIKLWRPHRRFSSFQFNINYSP